MNVFNIVDKYKHTAAFIFLRFALQTLVVLGLILLILTQMGCGDSDNSGAPKESEKQVALVIIGSDHSNAEKIPFSSSEIRDLLHDTAYSYGDVTFINCDGDPKPFYQAKIDPPQVSGLSDNKLEEIASDYTSQLMQILKTAESVSPEVDTYKAILQGAQALRGVSENTTDKRLLILDSGLSTTGYMDFRTGLVNANAEDVVAALEGAKALPDLSGVEVTWAFIGETAAPQTELTEAEKANLKDIWRTVLLAAGASDVEFSDAFAAGSAVKGAPEVSVVDTADTGISVDLPEPIETVVLDEGSVKFVANSAEFVNADAARTAIYEMAAALIAHPQNEVYIIGTTASGEEAFCKSLSEARAQKVVDTLVEMGVGANRLTAMGLGFNDPWHLDDLDVNGKLIEASAAQNRKVMMVDVTSMEAESLF